MRYTSKNTPTKCPKCGETTIAKILYGKPMFSEKLKMERDQGKVVLGGCCVTKDDPVWQCTGCEVSIYKSR